MKDFHNMVIPLVVTMTTEVKLHPLVTCNSHNKVLTLHIGLAPEGGHHHLNSEMRGLDIGKGEEMNILSTAETHETGGESHTHPVGRIRSENVVRDHPIIIGAEVTVTYPLQSGPGSRRRIKMNALDPADRKGTS